MGCPATDRTARCGSQGHQDEWGDHDAKGNQEMRKAGAAHRKFWGIRISWLIFSLACNHRLHFPNGKTGWRGLEQMRKDCGTREFIAHPSVYLERSLSANLSDVPLTADNTRMEFST